MPNDTPMPAPLLRAAPNFRSIGGLPVAGGRRVRAGMVYRSDALDELDADDLAQLGSLSIRVCCDLRSDGERLARPSRWPVGAAPRTLALAVATDIRALMPDLVLNLRTDPSAASAARLMQHLYRDLPVACAPVLTRLFALMTDEHVDEALPLVVHCTAGKDRTGFVIAMLLAALGASEPTIRDDYLHTNARSARLHGDGKVAKLLHALIGVAPEADMLRAITAARSEYLDAAFARIRTDHGSVEAYLAERTGLDEARRRRLADRLLD